MKRYLVKGVVNELLAPISKEVEAFDQDQAWKKVVLWIRREFGWHYKLSREKVEIIEII